MLRAAPVLLLLASLLPTAALAEPPQAPALRLPAPAQSSQEAAAAAPLEMVPLPAPAHETPGLALSDFEALALGHHPTLVQAAARVTQAQGAWLQAGLYPNPTAGYLGSEIGSEGTAGQQGVFVGQELVTAGKLKLQRAAAAAEVRQAEQLLAAQRLRVLADVRAAFFEALAAQRGLDLVRRLQQISEERVETTRELVEGMEASRLELLETQLEANRGRIAAEQAENRYQTAWRRLAAVAGQPQMPRVPLAGELESCLTEVRWEEVIAKVWAISPELAAARAEMSRAGWLVRRAAAEPVPNVQVQASSQYDFASEETIAGLQVGVPLPLFDRNQGNIRRAQAELAAARANVARLELALQARLAGLFERYANARAQAAIYAERILPDARAALEVVTTAFQAGHVGPLELLAAQRAVVEAQLAYLAALGELHESLAVINALGLSGSLLQGE